MNFNKFINSDYLKSNPLCGIDTYKDELNLATGACTRQIKKLVFDGTEWWYNNSNNACCVLELSLIGVFTEYNPLVRCSHVPMATTQEELFIRQVDYGITFGARGADRICIRNKDCEPVDDFKAWLAAEYANGTPVTVWYVLETPTTETITVPSGLSGTEEGYLIQDGTPTPDNPIYPTANTVEKWFGINHYIMGTDTDTITTLPADIYANGTTATVGLKGNMEQSGTPTPTTPIQPQETGDRTENLFDILTVNSPPFMLVNGTAQNAYGTLSDGVFTAKYGLYSQGIYLNYMLELSGGTYTISFDVKETIRNDMLLRVRDYDGETNILNETIYNIPSEYTNITRSFTITNTTKILIGIQPIGNAQQFTNLDLQFKNITLNTGSTALPYEPYGYKIPILSANTTTNIYLGEVQSTRQIKKHEFTGQEDWSISNNERVLYTALADHSTSNELICYCSHYKSIANVSAMSTLSNGECTFNNTLRWFYIKDNNYNDTTAFKTYLQQQYAAGTPVTVWYVLNTPETAVVNEPIRKIGDYADTVSDVSIPTTTGKDTFDVLTTLKPSEVSLAYTGWHDAIVHEKSRNLFDKTVATLSYYVDSSTGDLVGGNTYFASDYIEVEQGEEYYWNDIKRGNAGAFYDSNKTYISGWNSSQTRYIFTVPSGAKYVRLTGDKANIDTYMLSKGSTELPYEPYWN